MAANPTLAEIIDAIETAPPDEETRVTRRHAASVIATQLELSGSGWPGEGASADMQRLRDARRMQQVRAARRVSRWGSARIITTTLSQNALAHLVGIDPAHINRLEAGTVRFPSRDIALRLADALELDEIDQARLIIAAGFWPWPETDDADTELAVRVLLSVVRGDYRRVEAP